MVINQPSQQPSSSRGHLITQCQPGVMPNQGSDVRGHALSKACCAHLALRAIHFTATTCFTHPCLSCSALLEYARLGTLPPSFSLLYLSQTNKPPNYSRYASPAKFSPRTKSLLPSPLPPASLDILLPAYRWLNMCLPEGQAAAGMQKGGKRWPDPWQSM